MAKSKPKARKDVLSEMAKLFASVYKAGVPSPMRPGMEEHPSSAECVPVLDQIKEWVRNHQGYDTRRFHMLSLRLGFEEKSGRVPTLQELGNRFGLTKERIRQMERKAWDKMMATQPMLVADREVLSQKIRNRHGLLPLDDLRDDPRFGSLAAAQGAFQVMVGLGWVPGARILKARKRVFMSLMDSGQTVSLLRAMQHDLAKGGSDIDLEAWCSAYESTYRVDGKMAMAHIQAAYHLPERERLIKPRIMHQLRNALIAILESSPVPMHYREVISRIMDGKWRVTQTRIYSMLFSTPGIMLLGPGRFGTKRHFPEMDAITPGIVRAALKIMKSGTYQLERDWTMYALLPKIIERAHPPCRLDFYRLYIVLCSRPDWFIDTGRLTVRLNLSHGPQGAGQVSSRPVTRRIRHLLAIELLESAGGPMAASALEEQFRQYRDIRCINQLVVNYPKMFVILPENRIGLVPRDLPGKPGIRAKIADLMARILVSRGLSIKLAEAVETPSIQKLIPGLRPEELRAIILQDDRFMNRPFGKRADLAAWKDQSG